MAFVPLAPIGDPLAKVADARTIAEHLERLGTLEDRLRTRRREVPLEIVAEQAEADTDAAAHVVVMDEARRAAALLDTLPEKQRLTVSLRVQQGLSYREIGDVLDCTEGAARVKKVR
jgi:RNA polymerase sigma factor (sigma-70 family)